MNYEEPISFSEAVREVFTDREWYDNVEYPSLREMAEQNYESYQSNFN